jgi:hypothetical protein
MTPELRALANEVRHLARTSPVRLASRRARKRKRKRTVHATHGPQFRTTSVYPTTLPCGHARTLMGVPGTLSVGSPMKMLKPRYLSQRMQRVYKRSDPYGTD